jgi:hypothetical protein
VHEEFLGDGENRVYFAVVYLPEGSSTEVSTMVEPRQIRKFDSVRGLIIFDTRGFMYMVENEMSPFVLQIMPRASQVNPSSLTARQLESSLAELRRIKGSMVFR